ncbi:MAG: flavin reductase family protein [Sulfobacillus thermotolerans]|uniref:Flavin reductase n=1 Tax=Sulfobacillus thermotolerans TaxID=338644 RepID=A0ABM6RT52_9FIRM|nr:flavin reductase [Sulfobacillus thermotolerans]MCY0907414.1 flavin reductase family protein [Sulfobacillus thermotolerans]
MDQEAKKRSLRMITYGLYILTAKDGDDVSAGTVNWVSQASFAPPLIMVGVKKDSHLHEIVEKTGHMALSILGSAQKDIAADFFRPTNVEGSQLNGHEFEFSPEYGLPLLTETPAWFEARVTDAVMRGDHTIFVAEVTGAGVRQPDAVPLVMRETGWFYGG